MRRHLPTTLLACLAVLAALPTYASARKDQVSIIQDDARVLGGATRESTLDEMKALGADVVKISIFWRDVAATKPANAEDPASYPGAKWATYDSAISAAAARGLQVFVQVTGPAPDWAAGGKSTPAGTNRPNAAEFGRFAKAVGTRYSGTYTPPGGGPAPGGGGGPSCPPKPLPCPAPPVGQALASIASPAPAATTSATPLPAVHMWSIWNEPNLPVFLLPQRSSTRSHYPVSPVLYRKLYLAAHAGLAASGHGGDQILLGELLPVGKSSHTTRSSIRPLDFMRELACVDRHYHAYRGANAKARGCTGYKAIPLSGLAYHPYSLAGGPTTRPPSSDDATIGTLSRVTHVLDRLRARHRLAGPRRIPLWLTEFGVQTDPPDYLFGAPIKRVPTYLGMSERLAFRNSRVYSYSQYPLVDDRTNSGFQSGLRFSNGKAKPSIYSEYKLPIFVRRAGGSRIEFFGGVRAADSGGSVVLYSRRGSKAKFKPIKTVKLGAHGYFDLHTSLSSPSKRQYYFAFGKAKSILVTAH
ncbi:MAG: hypothetical protein ACJ76Z_03580 [Thermoleophilaceae bacterium]